MKQESGGGAERDGFLQGHCYRPQLAPVFSAPGTGSLPQTFNCWIPSGKSHPKLEISVRLWRKADHWRTCCVLSFQVAPTGFSCVFLPTYKPDALHLNSRRTRGCRQPKDRYAIRSACLGASVQLLQETECTSERELRVRPFPTRFFVQYKVPDSTILNTESFILKKGYREILNDFLQC